MASIFPAVAPDGSWTLPGFPRGGPAFPPWRFPEDAPAQGSDISDARCRDFGDGIVWNSAVVAHHVTHIPTVIPNVGIPFTSINVSTLMLDGVVGQQSLLEVMREFYTARGEEVLGVCVWEHRNSRIGPDLLGYEIEVFTKGEAQPFQPQIVARPDVQPFVITTLGLALMLFTAMIILDAFTGGQLGILDAFGQAWDTVTNSVEDIVQAPFKGVATVVVVGVAAFVGGAILLSRTGVEPEIATAALAGGRDVGIQVAGIPAAVTGVARGRGGGAGGRGRSRS